MNPRELELKAIAHEFAKWELKISNLNSLNLYDVNLFSENSICELLNCIFDYKLHNINALTKNHPAIDLGDEYNRVAIQVTSSKSSKKIQSTIDKFFENKLDCVYDELSILILGKKQNRYLEFNLPKDYSFNSDKHIIDFKDLLRFIKFLPTKKIKSISRLLIEENSSPQRRIHIKSNASKIKRILALKKRMKKDFLIELKREDWEYSWYEPWIKFKYRNLLIRSVDDTSFPNVDDESSGAISSWFKGEFWDFYENGLELISMGGAAIFDEKGNWDILDWRGDNRKNNEKFKTVPFHTFLRIPYEYIVEYDMETDPYYGIPSVYVQYLKEGMPYEEILYGQIGVYKLKRFTKYFDVKKRRKLK